MHEDDTRTAASPRKGSPALTARREVLGAAYVDAALADDTPGGHDFQRFVTDSAWGVWTRPGLSRRDRSLAVLAITAANGRAEEFALHLRGARRTGLTDREIDELVLQLAAYAGAPAGVSARRAVKAFRAEHGSDGSHGDTASREERS